MICATNMESIRASINAVMICTRSKKQATMHKKPTNNEGIQHEGLDVIVSC